MFLIKESDFEERETLFAEVILPLPLALNYTYRIPFELSGQVARGKRVVLQFGKHKMYTAIIKNLTHQPPEAYEAKYIIDVVDEKPVVNERQFELWDWMSQYYLCHEGEIMNAALPSGLKLTSETMISLRPDKEIERETLSAKELSILDHLEKEGRLTMEGVMKLLGQKTVYPIVNKLLGRELLMIEEEVVTKYKPLMKAFVKLQVFYEEEGHLAELFRQLERAPKQLDALLAYLHLSRDGKSVLKSQLLETSACGASALKSLIDKEVFSIEKSAVSRLNTAEEENPLEVALTPLQHQKQEEINCFFKEGKVVLLHGVTASGKTQLYIRQIEKALQEGGQVLFLLPEIALTTQIVMRIQQYFGAQLGVYHSKFNDNERVEIWHKVADGTYRIVIGARSAVFLPFQNLSLVIVDEEHEPSYKQYDPAPRYQARDAAVFLGTLFKASVLLGSATPSIESYFNAQSGKYGLVELKERYGGSVLPTYEIVSIADEMKRKKMVSYFSSVLIERISEALENKEQIILFQNRRGYATILICATCGFAPKCIHCDVNLTLHKSSGKLHCHYCGYHQESLRHCPACGGVHIEQKGFGTERIEEELSLLFPEVSMARLDLDSTRAKNAMQQILMDFQDKKTQILIGTQMVAKGLDFDKVSLIGVISADSLFNYPDFRAFERSFQLLTQVGGRAGRRESQGNVLIQTYQPSHRILGQVVTNDYASMYEEELKERAQYHYPPFSRMLILYLRHKDVRVIEQAAHQLAQVLKQQLGDRVLGPEQPLIARVRNYYIRQIVVKVEKTAPIQKVKQTIKETIRVFTSEKAFRSVWVQVDVDPY